MASPTELSAKAYLAELESLLPDHGFMSIQDAQTEDSNADITALFEKALRASAEAQFKIDCSALCQDCAAVYNIPWFGPDMRKGVVERTPAQRVKPLDWRHALRYESTQQATLGCGASKLHEFRLAHPL